MQIDILALGVLNQAREIKIRTWKRVKHLRSKVKELGPHAGNLRLELLQAECSHRDVLAMERGAKNAILKRKIELGLT